MKYLLLLALLFFILWRPLSRLRQRPRTTSAPERPPGGPGATAVDDIVPCAHCGLHLPRSDTIGGAKQGQRFCSPEHRDLGPRP